MKKIVSVLSVAAASLAMLACASTGGAVKAEGAKAEGPASSAKPVDFDLKAVCQFSFDAPGDGEIPDVSGSGNSGIIDADINLVAGKYGKALKFDGAETYIVMNDAVLDTADGWSFCVWVNPVSWADWSRIFDFGSGATSDLWLGFAGIERQLRLDMFAGDNVLQPLLVKTPAPGKWTHVAVTVGAGKASLYINGKLSASGEIAILPKDILKKASYIGRSNWPDPLYNGLMDDLLISGTCFTQAQIQSIMTGLPVAKK